MKFKTPREVFLYIAKMYGKPYKNRTRQQLKTTWEGICAILSDTGLYDTNYMLYYLCKEIILYYGDIGRSSYYYPVFNDADWKPEYDDLRCLDCLMMAEAWKDMGLVVS